MFPDMQRLYVDARDLGQPSAWDALTESRVPIPNDVDCILAGWPCADASRMNAQSGSEGNRTC
eukprot:13606048-Alexandrium_andersonii.AAC.1